MDIASRNAAIVIIGQCLLGVMSSNFKRVSIKLSDEKWEIIFDLGCDDSEDAEMIEDAIGELDGLVLDLKHPPSQIKYSLNVNGKNFFEKQDDDWIVILLKK